MVATFQLFPPLDTATEAALRFSISKHGVLVPIVVDQHGEVLDGHHRLRIAREVGVECPARIVECASEKQREEIARTLNEDRRHILPADLRRPVVAELRADGHPTRAIASALGVSQSTVMNDLAAVEQGCSPEGVIGRDGKRYPSTRTPRADTPDLGRTTTQTEIEEHLDEQIEAAIRKPDLGGGISHPARYSDALIPVFAALLDGYGRVLDPFAGTGQRLGALAADHELVGVEIEPEWAALSKSWVKEGNALDLEFAEGTFDAVCTSPTYGNRLADKHNASDPETRRSYTHDLGRSLSEHNSGGMQWGEEYRDFHMTAWSEAIRVLRPGGRFVLNIKDHIRDGELQPVSAWHVWALGRLGLDLDAALSREVTTPSLRAGANASARTSGEFVFVFEKP